MVGAQLYQLHLVNACTVIESQYLSLENNLTMFAIICRGLLLYVNVGTI